jgi:phage gp29-like protein
MAPLLNEVRSAVEDADGYEAADAALRRLEEKTRADGLESVLVGAMTNGTSAGSVDS